MAGTTYKTAPPGTRCCFMCHRYLADAKLDDRSRCRDRIRCQRAAARMIGLPARMSKATKRAFGIA